MTCIVALKENDKTYIAWDSFIGSNGKHHKTQFPKVIKIGEFVFGLTGYPRALQLIENYLSVKPQKTSQDDIQYLITEVITNIKTIFKEHGYSWVSSNHEYSEDIILLVYKKQIYTIDGNYQINQYTDNFTCIGSGEDFATGAMSAMIGNNPDYRVEKACKIAAEYCNTVCEPIHSMVIE